MKLCCRIGDGIETDSHGNTRKRNDLMHKVNVFLFVKFIHVFNSLNHWGHVEIIIPFKKINTEKLTTDFQSIAVEATDNFQGQFLA